MDVVPVAATPIRMENDKPYHSIFRKLIMHEDLNPAHRLFGGRILEWVDEAAALYVMGLIGTRHIVTKKISEIVFNEPAHLGDVLEFLFRPKHVGRTSITIECLVVTQRIEASDSSRIIIQCDIVFVALDRNGRPQPHNFDLARFESEGWRR